MFGHNLIHSGRPTSGLCDDTHSHHDTDENGEFQNFEMVDGRHLEKRYIATTLRKITCLKFGLGVYLLC